MIELEPSDLILSCPPAGPTTADESLFSMVLPSGNFVFTFVLGGRPPKSGLPDFGNQKCRNRQQPISIGGRLEGWQQARPNTRPSFETRPSAAPQDEGLNYFPRRQITPFSRNAANFASSKPSRSDNTSSVCWPSSGGGNR